jgi:DNA polymerase III subunit delta
MVGVKAHQVAQFIKSIDPAIEAALVYGSDEGMVAERARDLAERFAKLTHPPGEVIRIEDADIEAEPGRLAMELRTIAMFGGRKIVRTATSRRVTADTLATLLSEGGLEGRLIVEAGALKAEDKFRALFEKSPTLAALPCYGDEGQDLDRLVTEVLRAAKLDIAPDARHLLIAKLGADRALSRGEIEKLVLFVRGRRSITVEDVDAIVGDASAQTIDRVLAAMASGRPAEAVSELDRALSAGEHPQMIIGAVQRHLQRLHRVLAQTESGRPISDVIKGFRPFLHFKAKDALMAEVQIWSADRVADALDRAATALITARTTSTLESAIAERLVLEIATLARASRNRSSSSAVRH